MSDSNILQQLDTLLAQRRNADPATSYTASLYAGGTAAIVAKVSEESAEVVAAAEQVGHTSDSAGARAHLVHEVADLWFHCMVLLQAHGLSAAAVQDELARRFGVSGFEEKAARSTQ